MTASTGIVSEREDGLPCVVFERRLPHPTETVWAALTEPAQRAVWVPGIRFEPKPGAPYDISFGDECEGSSHVSGVLGAFDPPRELALGSIHIQLRAEGESGEGLPPDLLGHALVRQAHQGSIGRQRLGSGL